MRRLSLFLIAAGSLCAQNWYNSGWQYRKLKAVDHRRVTGDLTNFPVLVRFDNDADLAGHLQSSCHDFLVTLADGTKLNHEIRKCDATEGTVHAMVRVPSLSSSADTPLLVYYGNASAADQSNPSGVWDANFKLVLPGGGLTDATTNHINATLHGNTPQTIDGVYGSAYRFDGISSYLTTASAPVTTAYTLDFWYKADSAGDSSTMMTPLVGTNNNSFGLAYNTYEPWEDLFYHGWTAGGAHPSGGYPIAEAYDRRPPANMWHHAIASWNGSAVSVYVDGILLGTGAVTTLDSFTGGLFIAGNASKSVRTAVGEVRLSNIARSKPWIFTEYANYIHPETFFVTGAQETNRAAAPVIHFFGANYEAVEPGKPVVLQWLVSNAGSVSIDQGLGAQPAAISGTLTLNPASTTTYTLTAANGSGTSTAQKTIAVLVGTVAYPRYGKPGGTWIRSYSTDGSGHAVMETWEPHNYVPGDYVLQYGNCSSDSAHHYASNLNGKFMVAEVVDAGHYTLKDLNGGYISPNASWTWCKPPSGNAAIWTGRAVPVALPAGPKGPLDGIGGKTARHVATSTDNGLVSLVVSGGTATATFSYAHDSKVGEKISVWNTTASGDLNGEHVISAVTSNSYSFSTNAPAGTYTHNDTCGPGAGNPNAIGGTANCVVISQWAYAANPFWARIVADTNFATSSDYTHIYDGGKLAYWGPDLQWPYIEAAYRFLVDRKRQILLDALVYITAHVERYSGVNFAVMMGSDEGGSASIGHTWMFNWNGMFMPYAVANYLGHLTAAQKLRYRDAILNDISDPNPANQCTETFPAEEVLATGTAQGGDGTHIVLAVSDTAADNYYVNNIITFADASYRYWGVVTSYVAATKTATVSNIMRASSYTSQNEAGVASWSAPTTSTQYKVLATATISGSTLTGYNTNWLTSLAPGDGLVTYYGWPAVRFPSNEYYVAAIGNDNTATVRFGGSALGTSTPRPVWILKQWDQSQRHCGLLWRTSYNSGVMGPQSIQYPGSAGNSAKSGWHYMPAMNDEGGGSEAFFMAMGAALADDDPRAVDIYQRAQSKSIDYDTRFLLGYRGLSSNGTHYGTSVEAWEGCFAFQMMGNTLPSWMLAPVWTSPFIRNWQTSKQFLILPDDAGGKYHQFIYGTNSGGPEVFVEPGTTGKAAAFVQDCGSVFNPAAPEAAYLRDFVIDKGLYSSVVAFTAMMFPLNDPRIRPSDYTAQPLQYLVSPGKASEDACKQISGWDHQLLGCGVQKGDTFFSKTSWTDKSSSEVMFESRSCCSCCYDVVSGGLLKAYKVGHLLNDDSNPPGNLPTWTLEDTTEKAQMPRFDEKNTLRLETSGAFSIARTFMARWAHNGGTWGSEYGDENSRYAYAMADLTGAYSVTYNRVWRHVIHFKKPGTEEVLVQFDDIDASNVPPAKGMRFGVHYAQNGESGNATNGDVPPYNEGVTTCPGPNGCAGLDTDRVIFSHEDGHAADSNGPARTAGVITRWFSPGAMTLRWDGRYTGGYGHTDRVSVCAGSGCGSAASTLESITVHKIVPDFNTDTSLTAAPLNPDSNWTGVQTADKVALFARGGVFKTSLAVTTTHAGTAQYLIAGLAAGVYSVTVAGTPAAGSPFTVTDGDNSLYFESPAGAVSISRAVLTCSITNAALPAGTVGVGYSAPLQTANCTAPLTWTVSAESLCAGLSLDPGGAISGIPAATGTCEFTLRATDAGANIAERSFSIAINARVGAAFSVGVSSTGAVWR
jgi:hypothetical protein